MYQCSVTVKKKDVRLFPCACEKVQSFKESVTDLVWEVDSAELEEKNTDNISFENSQHAKLW